MKLKYLKKKKSIFLVFPWCTSDKTYNCGPQMQWGERNKTGIEECRRRAKGIDKRKFSPYECCGPMGRVLIHSPLNFLALYELCVRDGALTGKGHLDFSYADMKFIPTFMQVKFNVTKFLIIFGSKS